MNTLWLLLLTGILAAAQAVVFRVWDMRRLSYKRRFDRSTAYEGQQVELLEYIRNRKILPVPWLRAESRIPQQLSFDRQELSSSHEVSGGMYHKSLFFIPPMSAITRHHTITLKRRGVYQAGSVALTAGDLFSIVHTEKQADCDCSITVYPAILPESELPDPANRWMGEAVVRRWIMPDPFLVNGIRDYAQGDSLRDIHWKASARTGDLRVKVHDYTADPKVLVVLNVQTSEFQWSDVGESEAETIEYGIRVAATLCARALKYGLSAGFATNACFENTRGSGQGIYVPSKASAEHEGRLLDAMARMLLHREVNFHTFLGDLKDVQGEDILILSCYENDDVLEAEQALRLNGNTVSCVRLERRQAS